MQTLFLFAKNLSDIQGRLPSGLRHEEEVEYVGGEGDSREHPECSRCRQSVLEGEECLDDNEIRDVVQRNIQPGQHLVFSR